MPVKISDALMIDARANAESAQRSIAGQIEHWARLGKAVEAIMRVSAVTALKEQVAMTLNESVAQIGTPAGQRRLNSVLQNKPFPPLRSRARSGGLPDPYRSERQTHDRTIYWPSVC